MHKDEYLSLLGLSVYLYSKDFRKGIVLKGLSSQKDPYEIENEPGLGFQIRTPYFTSEWMDKISPQEPASTRYVYPEESDYKFCKRIIECGEHLSFRDFKG